MDAGCAAVSGAQEEASLSNVYKDHQDPPKICFYVTLHAGGQGRVRASHGGSQAVPIRPGLSSLE